MAKFLFTTLPSNDLGLLTRSLPVAAELVHRGHQVAFCSPGLAPSKLIAEAGLANLIPKHPFYHLITWELSLPGIYRLFKTRPWQRDFGNLFNFLRLLLPAIPTKFVRPTAQIWNADHAGAMVGLLNENFVRANCAAMCDLMSDYGPDVVVDFWNPFACIAAKAMAKPLVTIIQADAHPASQGFIWWQGPPPADIPSPVPVVNKVLAGYNLPPISKTEELGLGDLTLVIGTPETDPLPDEAKVTYIGPILWQKPEARLPAWVEELRPDQPIIWVYSGNPRYMPGGTPADSAVVPHASIAALAEEAVQVVLTTGHHALPRQWLPLPPNFYHESYVPGLAMAYRSDLLIHHGGYGSCQIGLYTGTPAVIIPTMAERESNARRVAALGAGEFIVPTEDRWGRKSVPVKELQAKVQRVLTDPSFTENARQVSQRMQTYGGAAEAARLIEGFCS